MKHVNQIINSRSIIGDIHPRDAVVFDGGDIPLHLLISRGAIPPPAPYIETPPGLSVAEARLNREIVKCLDDTNNSAHLMMQGRLPYPSTIWTCCLTNESMGSRLDTCAWVYPLPEERYGEYVSAYEETKERLSLPTLTDDVFRPYVLQCFSDGAVWSPISLVFTQNKEGSLVPGSVHAAKADDLCRQLLSSHGMSMLTRVVLQALGMSILSLSAIQYLGKVLSCKNVEAVDVHPPEKLQRARARRGKPPLISYKTLQVRPVASQRKGETAVPSRNLNRVHLCRGHFKSFSPDRPLLGRHTGTYWWEPQARGNRRKGMVVKDYKLQGEAA